MTKMIEYPLDNGNFSTKFVNTSNHTHLRKMEVIVNMLASCNQFCIVDKYHILTKKIFDGAQYLKLSKVVFNVRMSFVDPEMSSSKG